MLPATTMLTAPCAPHLKNTPCCCFAINRQTIKYRSATPQNSVHLNRPKSPRSAKARRFQSSPISTKPAARWCHPATKNRCAPRPINCGTPIVRSVKRLRWHRCYPRAPFPAWAVKRSLFRSARRGTVCRNRCAQNSRIVMPGTATRIHAARSTPRSPRNANKTRCLLRAGACAGVTR